MNEVINNGMKKVIKGMIVTCQTARFISLMPKPKDFVTRIVGDVVYISTQVQKLSDDINRMLDSYAQIPSSYLMVQMNSIMGSMVSITDRLNTYSQNGVNQVMGIGENTLDMASELTGGIIDTIGSASNAVASLGMTVAHTSAAVLGQKEVASDIKDASDVVLEWTSNGFKTVKENTTAPLNKASQSITDAKTQINQHINDKANAITDSIKQKQKWVEDLLNELREKMNALANKLDSGFNEVTGVSSISKGASYVSEALKESDNNSPSAQMTQAVAESLSNVLKNFSISKVIAAFGGILTQSVIVKTGLNNLPPIDFESMLYNIRGDLKKDSNTLYEELNLITENTKHLMDDRDYDMSQYNEFVKQYDEEIKTQRDSIRLALKNTKRENTRQNLAQELLLRRETRTAIKEVNKFRKQVKNAKKANKYMSIVGNELERLRKDVEYKCNSIKSDWESMMTEYRLAIKEIKDFFQGKGDGDMYVNDCCKAINDDCKKIKDLCKNLTSQLIGCAIKVAMPADIGAVVPNPVYKIADFWMDIKTIFKFIVDLITLIIDILNHINKLARVMLNGFNDLNEIIKQLFELLGLKWFMNLVQTLIDFFGNKIKDARILLENMLSPIYYRDTKEYENSLEALESIVTESGWSTMSSENVSFITDTSHLFNLDAKKMNNIQSKKLKEDDYDELIKELEDKGDEIVAYKSPILKMSNSSDKSSSVSDIVDGEDFDNDIIFIGWHFFHPDLNYTESDVYSKSVFKKLLRKIKSKIIKRASKTSHKSSGGIKKLQTKMVDKRTSYSVFHWYDYYTTDLEKDCFDMGTAHNLVIIDSVVQTENGSIVEIDGRKVFVANNMVRSGDYVTVDGVKYRVK